MIRFTDNHAARLKLMTPARVRAAVGDQLEKHAHSIAEDAAFSIRDGAISGAGHVASLPGEAPNANTHDLDQSIHIGETIETAGEIKTSVIADSDHAWIERGGANMAPRPYMAPAVERQRGSTVRGVAKRVSHVFRGGE